MLIDAYVCLLGAGWCALYACESVFSIHEFILLKSLSQKSPPLDACLNSCVYKRHALECHVRVVP